MVYINTGTLLQQTICITISEQAYAAGDPWPECYDCTIILYIHYVYTKLNTQERHTPKIRT